MKIFLYYLIIYLLTIDYIYANIVPPLLNSPANLSNLKNYDLSAKENPDKNKKNKKNFPTRWGGNALVQSQETINGIDVTIYKLTGNAWIIHKNVRLVGDTIEIIGQDAVKANLTGGVTVYDNENGTVLKAERGKYDKFEETIHIEGNPVIIYKSKNGNNTIARSKYIKRTIPDSKTELAEFIEIQNKDFTILSDKAVLFEKEDRFEIPDKPMVFGNHIFMNGDSLVYTEQDENITLKNHPVIVQRGKDSSLIKTSENPDSNDETKTDDQGKREEKTTLATADELIYHNDGDINSYTGLFGNAFIINDTTTVQADFIKSYGKENDKLEARNNIIVNDKKEKIVMKGNVFDYNKAKNYSHLTDNVSAEFLNKKTEEVQTTMTAVEFERYFDIKEIVARGDVIIHGDDYNATGAYATYFEDLKKIHLEGNPSLIQDGKKINSGRIIIFPDTNQIILSDGIKLQSEE